MNTRTTDHMELIVANFYKTHKLEDAVKLYVLNDAVLEKLAAGHRLYMQTLTEAEKNVPEDLADVVTEAAEKLVLERTAYDEKITEIFKIKFCEVFSSAIMYLDIRDMLFDLLYRGDDENLMVLFESAMDDVLSDMANHIDNVISLLMQGMPLELAETIAEQAGDATVCPIEVVIGSEDDDFNEEEICKKDYCNGECGGKCVCEGKDTCEHVGCCHANDPRD